MVVSISTPRESHAEPIAPTAVTVALDDTSEAALRIPFTITDGWHVVEGASVIGVALGTRRDGDLFDAFKASEETDTGFTLTAERKYLRRPGTYQVTVQVTAKGPSPAEGKPEAVARSLIEVSVVRIPPAIHTPAALIVDIERVPFQNDTVRSTPFAVMETKRAVDLNDVALHQIGTNLRENAPAFGILKAELVDSPKKPGTTTLSRESSSDVKLTPSGFDLGTTTGTLSLTANELSEQLLIPFSVSTRRSAWLVFALFLLGGIAGHLFRRLAKDAQTRATLFQEADRNISALRQLAERSPPGQRRELANQILDLRQAATTSNDKLIAELAKATSLLERVVKELDAMLADGKPRLATLSQVASLQNVPPPLDRLIEELPPLLGKASGMRDAANAAAMQVALDEAESVLSTAVSNAGPALQSLHDEVSALKEAIGRGPSQLDDDAGVVDQFLAALDAVRSRPNRETLAPTLIALDTSARGLSDYVQAAARKLRTLAAEANAILVNGRKVAEELEEATRVPLAGDLLANVHALAARINAVRQPIQTRIVKYGSRAAQADTALQQRDFLGALKQLEPLLEPAQGGPNVALDVNPLPEASKAGPSASSRAFSDVGPFDTGLPLLTKQVETRSTLARYFQMGLAFAILPLGAYLIYGPSFIGTNLEIGAILATAFVTDFTADAAVAALEKLKKA
jgi:hypothetical protein